MTGKVVGRAVPVILILAGLAASYPARPNLDPSGSIEGAFSVGGGFNGVVSCLAAGPAGSGDVYVGGAFTTYQGNATNRIVRLNPDGSVDSGFAAGAGFASGPLEYPSVLAPMPNGDLYVGGGFTSYQGSPANRIVRLNSDGTIDAGFTIGSGFTASGYNAWIYAVVLIPDGSGDIYVAGYFTSYNGTARNGIIRLNVDGTIDSAFDAGPGLSNGGITSLALAADGSGDVYAIGTFSAYNGNEANHMLRLNSDGTLDTEFDSGSGFSLPPTNLNLAPYVLAMPSDGSGDVLVGGEFTTYNGTSANRLVRLNSDGSIDASFDAGTGFNNTVQTIALGPAGDLYVGGLFATYQGSNANRLVRLNSDASIDAAFETGTGFTDAPSGFYARIWGLARAPDGSGDLYVGGRFTNYNGTDVNRIVRLNADPPAPPPPPTSAPPPSLAPPTTVIPNSGSGIISSKPKREDILPCTAGSSAIPSAIFVLAAVVALAVISRGRRFESTRASFHEGRYHGHGDSPMPGVRYDEPHRPHSNRGRLPELPGLRGHK